MLVLLHALIPCLAAYILPSSPVLLRIYCTTFWHYHPSILQNFNGNVFTPFSGGSRILLRGEHVAREF